MTTKAGPTDGKENNFGSVACRLGLTTPQRISECVEIQKKMLEMGIQEPLGEILAKKGYLNTTQNRQVLKAMGVQTSPIPGYTDFKKIGQGGMGTVYKAIQTSVNRVVAVKILSTLMTKDPSFVSRFTAEAKSAAKLNHKNIIGAIDSGETDGIHYFIMEYVDGCTTRDLIHADGVFEESRALDIALQVAQALDYIHQNKIIHRDIKPENIIVMADETVKLCDLGLARSTEVEQSLTQEGFTVGTPYYMSPEQVTSEKDIDIRGDLYSLGATIYFLSTGHWVFEGKTAAETMSLHLTVPAPNPRNLNPRLSEDFGNILLKLLEKKRKDRYQTPKDLLADLGALKVGRTAVLARQYVNSRTSKATHRRVHLPQPKSKTPFAIAAGVAVVLGVALIIALSNRPPATPAPPPPAQVAATPSPRPTPVESDREREAARLNSEAEALFTAGRFEEARAKYVDLDRNFRTTSLCTSRQAEISARIGKCDAGLATSLKEVEQLYSLAGAHATKGNFKEARLLYEQLLARNVQTPLVTPELLNQLLATCIAEMNADDEAARIRLLAGERKWQALMDETIAYGERYRSTSTGRRQFKALSAMVGEGRREMDAERAIAEAKACAAAKKWSDLPAILDRIDSDFSGTETVRGARPLLTGLRDEFVKARSGESEAMARADWDKVERAVQEHIKKSKYDEARGTVENWRDKYRLTQEAQARSAAVTKLLADLEARSTRLREERAVDAVKMAKQSFAQRNYETCYLYLETLSRGLMETAAGRREAGVLKSMREECENTAGLGAHVQLLFDFEKEDAEWAATGDASELPTLARVETALTGTSAAHVGFFRYATGTTASMLHPVDGMKPGAETIVLSVRTPPRGPAVTGRLGIRDGDREFYHDFAVSSEWKRVALKLSDFKMLSGTGEKKINLDSVTHIGFITRGKDAPAEFIVDNLRVEEPKK